MANFIGDFRAVGNIEGVLPMIEADDEADFEFHAMTWVRDNHEFAHDVEILNVEVVE